MFLQIIIYMIKLLTEKYGKYQINLIASSTSFYMIFALYSMFLLLVQIRNYFISNNDFLINKLIDIINPIYLDSLEKFIPVYSIDKLTPLIFVNLIWSASNFINGFIKASDIIYCNHKKRNYFVNRISSVILFLLIVITIIFELLALLFANIIIKYIIKNIYIYMFIQFIIEFILLFSIILLINKFVPAVKLSFKQVLKGTLISTILIYLFIICYLFSITTLSKIYKEISILTIISISFIFFYLLNVSLIIGIYYNYYLQIKPL